MTRYDKIKDAHIFAYFFGLAWHIMMLPNGVYIGLPMCAALLSLKGSKSNSSRDQHLGQRLYGLWFPPFKKDFCHNQLTLQGSKIFRWKDKIIPTAIQGYTLQINISSGPNLGLQHPALIRHDDLAAEGTWISSLHSKTLV